MDIKEIKQIIELMNENELSYFHLERDGEKIKLRKGVDINVLQQAMGAIQPIAAPAASVAALPAASEGVIDDDSPPPGAVEITSPMVGTFYRATSPDSPMLAEIGNEVVEDTTVCIIEAMKVMNEITAEVRGTITHVLVENGTPVQYGEPLFWVKKA